MSEKKTFQRFNVERRLEHWVLVISFALLGITGLIQKFPMNDVSLWLIHMFGGIELTRIIHRVSAFVFGVESIYHFGLAGYKLFVLKEKASMMPQIKDALDGLQALAYNLGLRKEAPRMGRYNFGEKLEYWAMLWGLLVMGVTGFIMWNPIASSKIFPGQFIPAAKAAHGGEAVLAVLAIIIWHFYNVHIRHLNKSIFTGNLTREEMEEEHALELEEIEAGLHITPVPTDYKKRRMIYLPISFVVTALLVGGVYYLSVFEDSAIHTVPPPRADVAAYMPFTATPVPTAAPTPTPLQVTTYISWNDGLAAVFQTKCAACHTEFLVYSDMMDKGFILSEDVEGSPVVVISRKGGHLAELDSTELDLVVGWIEAGAPEE